MNQKSLDTKVFSRRVLNWYRLFSLGGKPIVVIGVQERAPGKEPAQLHQAAHQLAVKNIRVVVDAADDALLYVTRRENVFEMEPMSPETIRKIDHLSALIAYLEDVDMFDVAAATFGGLIVNWMMLNVMRNRLEGDE